MAKIHFISLGCPKNRVDAEHMLGSAVSLGHEIIDDPEQADTIIVNTCSFIGEAKQESINAILEMAKLKEDGGQKLVVSGCLAQRYVGELEKELPEVDHFIGTSDYMAIGRVLGDARARALAAEANQSAALDGFVPLTSLTAGKKNKDSKETTSHTAQNPAQSAEAVAAYLDGAAPVQGEMGNATAPRNLVTTDLTFVAGCDMPRINSMPRYTAYLKIAEGCDNTCAFCIIPALRGKQRSRPIDDLVREAKHLAAQGVVEINLIAQDLTGYGHDLDGRPTLAMLLEALSGVEGIRWVRCMYAYPRTLSSHLLQQLDQGRNILPYLDIPTQHGSDRMLRLMKRGRDQKRLTELLTKVRDQVRNVVLRSTVIVGFPGEEDEDFDELVDFAEALRFERLGVFKYSDEEGTAAYDFEDKVPAKIKRTRYDKLMRRQRRIHADHLKELVGQVHEAIVEGFSEDHEYVVVGRLWSQAPEIDGIAYLSSSRPLTKGEIVYVEITETHDYDVVAEVLDEDDARIQSALPFKTRALSKPTSVVGPIEGVHDVTAATTAAVAVAAGVSA